MIQQVDLLVQLLELCVSIGSRDLILVSKSDIHVKKERSRFIKETYCAPEKSCQTVYGEGMT